MPSPSNVAMQRVVYNANRGTLGHRQDLPADTRPMTGTHRCKNDVESDVILNSLKEVKARASRNFVNVFCARLDPLSQTALLHTVYVL